MIVFRFQTQPSVQHDCVLISDTALQFSIIVFRFQTQPLSSAVQCSDFRHSPSVQHDCVLISDTAPQFSSTVFSLLLMHYMTKLSHLSTPPHISHVLVAQFSLLPWEQLKPDLQLLETMAQVKKAFSRFLFSHFSFLSL